MKKTVLTFGLISGAISSSLMMLVAMPLTQRIGFDNGEILGYTTIVLSFLMVYVGVRSYRENNGGTITFGRALGVGLLITLISCACYVASWEILYFNFGFGHEFLDKYSAYQTERPKRREQVRRPCRRNSKKCRNSSRCTITRCSTQR